MPAVTIYNQKDLAYVVLPSRKILSKEPDEIARSISKAENHISWIDQSLRERLQTSGEVFFKEHEKQLGSDLSMGNDDGKMSDGFFLYQTYTRFQNPIFRAYFITDEEVAKLTNSNIQKSADLSKLLVLETALEYLIKAERGESLEYLGSGENPPEDTQVHTTRRGARGYFPSEIGKVGKPAEEARSLEPDAARPIEGIQAPEPELVNEVDDDDDDEGQAIIGDKIDAASFIEKMREQGFRPLDELIQTFPRISVDQKKELVRQAALEGKGPQTDATPITPNIAVVNEDGKVVNISTADGQLQAVQEFDPENPDRGGKQHLFFSTDADDKVQVAWIDGKGRQHAGYSVTHTKSQAIKKFEKIKKLAKIIPGIEKSCKQDIQNNGRNKEAALALALIHNTYRRVGSGESKVVWDGEEGRPGPKKDKDGKFIREYVSTFGVTSFQAQHIIVKGKKVYLNFLGKSGKLNNVEVTDPLVKNELIARRKAAGKDKTATVLNVSPPAVNAYLKQAADGDFSVKNFRTYHATRLAATLVAKTKIPRLDRKKFDAFMKRRVNSGAITTAQEWKEESFLWALKERNKLKLDIIGEPISDQLSNTKQVCVAQYIDPQVFKEWDISFDGDVDKLLRSRFPAADVKAAQQKLKNKDKAPAKAKPKGKGKSVKRKKK